MLLAGAIGLQGQALTDWTAASSVPSTQDLHGVAYGNAGYVAVGANGTILTSPDGLTWTSRASPTNQNLLAVTAVSSPTLYVAVGASGTILTSPDGVVWSARTSGTTATLNGVAGFLAVGNGGEVCTSTNGITWTAGNAGVSADLTGVCRARDSSGSGVSVVCGAGGTLLFTPDGTHFTLVATGTALNFEGVALSSIAGQVVTAVGDQGVSGTLTFTSTGVGFVLNPATSLGYRAAAYADFEDVNEEIAVGDRGEVASFPPGGSSLALPTQANFYGVCLAPPYAAVAVGQGGVIWESNPSSSPIGNGGITGAPPAAYVGQSVTLSAPDLAGASYQWLLNGAPIAGANRPTLGLNNLQGTQAGNYTLEISGPAFVGVLSTTLIVQAIASYSPGLVDPTFLAGAGTGSSSSDVITVLPGGRVLIGGQVLVNANGSLAATLSPAIASETPAVVQPDGKWVVVGKTPNLNGSVAAARYNSDGTQDTSFAIASSLLSNSSVLALLPDGRWLLLSAPAGNLQWLRLAANGAVDPTFGSTPATAPYSSQGQPGTIVAAVDALGRAWVAVNWVPAAPGATLFRLRSDQTLDPAVVSPGLLSGLLVNQLQPVGAEVLFAATGPVDLGSAPPREVGLLTATGAADPAQPPKGLPATSAVALQSDGSVVALVRTTGDASLTTYLCERFDPAGNRDLNFSGVLVGDPYVPSAAPTPTVPPGFDQITPLASGQYLVAGAFATLNGVPSGGLARITPDTHYAATRLGNFSVRTEVVPAVPLTLGFVLSGNSTKGLLLRGAGPALLAFGVAQALADPKITLFGSATTLASNDNWSSDYAVALATLAGELAAFPFSPGSLDAGLIASLPAGAYTLQLSGQGGSGVALAEAYDEDVPPADFTGVRITNFSSRGQTGLGDQVMTAGFVVAGSDVKKVLIRAVGPGLAGFGVGETLADPVLSLYQNGNLIASNDNWSTATSLASTPDAIQAAASSVGAFALAAGSNDAGLLLTLPPGAYTAVATGAGGSTGQVLIEIYEVP